MRTWKQGAVGKISLTDGKAVFLKCLKYPLASFYRTFDGEAKTFDGGLFYAFLDLSVLRHIERIDEIQMSPSEKKTSRSFSIDFMTNEITPTKGADESAIRDGGLRVLLIDDIKQLIAETQKKI